jgi:hypothetical protein
MRIKILMRLVVPALLMVFALDGFAQEGPPGKEVARKKKAQAQSQTQSQPAADFHPFPTDDEIAARFQKDWGIPPSVFKEIQAAFLGRFASESADEKSGETTSEKSSKSAINVLILAIADVNAGEKAGSLKKENRTANIQMSANKIVNRLKNTDVGWGDLSHEVGFDGPQELFEAARAIEWEDPIPKDLERILVFKPETK